MLRTLFLLGWASLATWAGAAEPSPFTVRDSEQGIELLEDGAPVFHFQLKERSLGGKWPRSHYLHPVYDLDGKVMTEDFPEDHRHHRGIFWAWHQLKLEGQTLADPWVCRGIQWTAPSRARSAGSQHPGVKVALAASQATLTIERQWTVAVNGEPTPVVSDTAVIGTGAVEDGVRRIDFEIRLRALRPGIALGGSENVKGYGGFSTRFALNPPLKFYGPGGVAEPKVGAVPAGKWLTMRRQTSAEAQEIEPSLSRSHASILCHPDHPGFPPPWILRNKRSMQNVAWPGRDAIKLSVDKPVVLKYRLLIHREPISAQRLNRMWRQYAAAGKLHRQETSDR